jgi:Uma2 family endonuclease
MSTLAAKRLTADEFLIWADAQANGRYELVCGELFAMAPERADHARVKAATWAALKSAIKRAGVTCEAFIDGLAVRINDSTVYEPDALVNCGARVQGNVIVAPNPVIVVEVLSPSTQHIDKTAKLIDYFSLAAVQHYLVIDIERRAIMHHRKDTATTVATTICRQGQILLDPPGLEISVADLLDF